MSDTCLRVLSPAHNRQNWFKAHASNRLAMLYPLIVHLKGFDPCSGSNTGSFKASTFCGTKRKSMFLFASIPLDYKHTLIDEPGRRFKFVVRAKKPKSFVQFQTYTNVSSMSHCTSACGRTPPCRAFAFKSPQDECTLSFVTYGEMPEHYEAGSNDYMVFDLDG